MNGWTDKRTVRRADTHAETDRQTDRRHIESEKSESYMARDQEIQETIRGPYQIFERSKAKIQNGLRFICPDLSSIFD